MKARGMGSGTGSGTASRVLLRRSQRKRSPPMGRVAEAVLASAFVGLRMIGGRGLSALG
jgi:hypothetical protein